jgi:hypothetical protein
LKIEDKGCTPSSHAIILAFLFSLKKKRFHS